MDEQQNDLDPAAETAVVMDDRPTDRPVARHSQDGALSRRARDAGTGDAGEQETGIQGPGYPTEDMDDVAAGPGEEDELDEEELDDLDDDDTDDDLDDDPDEDDEPMQLGAGAEVADLLPPAADAELLPPGGDALGGDRDADPNLNGGHGIGGTAPEEGPVPIEIEPTDLSIIGHGHEDKAAWNRARVAHLQEIEDGERDVRPATTEALGIGGAVVAGALEGWEGGEVASTLAVDDRLDDENSEEEEVLGDVGFADIADAMSDGSLNDPNQGPRLPEHASLEDGYDTDIPDEERLLAVPGEDPLVAANEFGVVEELEMEQLNETDSISELYEDTREVLTDSMEGNELRRNPGEGE